MENSNRDLEFHNSNYEPQNSCVPRTGPLSNDSGSLEIPNRGLSRSWNTKEKAAMAPPSETENFLVTRSLTSDLMSTWPRSRLAGEKARIPDARHQEGHPPEKEDHLDNTTKRRLRLKWCMLGSTSITTTCYMMGLLILLSVQSQYLYQRFAQDSIGTNVTQSQLPCLDDSNDTFKSLRSQIQAKTSRQSLFLDCSAFIPGIFVCLLIGSYSDYLGRRFMVLLPTFGAFVKSAVFLIVIYLELDVNYLFIGYASDGLGGSFYGLQLGLSAAISDVTESAKERVLAFAFLEGSIALAASLSQIGAGYLIKTVGFFAPVIAIACLLLLAVISVVFFMPETLHRPDDIIWNPVTHLRKVFGFYLFDGSVRLRCMFVCGLLAFFFTVMCNMGRVGVWTLYVLNAPFCWDSIKIGIYSGIRILVQVTFSVLALKVFQNSLRHEVIGMLGVLSGAACFAMEGFATTDWMLYLAPVLGCIYLSTIPVIRTLMSKMAPSTSQGALFASMAAVETICNLVSSTTYNTVYQATLDLFSGTVFLLMSSFSVICFLLLIVFVLTGRKLVKSPNVMEIAISGNSGQVYNETTPLLKDEI